MCHCTMYKLSHLRGRFFHFCVTRICINGHQYQFHSACGVPHAGARLDSPSSWDDTCRSSRQHVQARMVGTHDKRTPLCEPCYARRACPVLDCAGRTTSLERAEELIRLGKPHILRFYANVTKASVEGQLRAISLPGNGTSSAEDELDDHHLCRITGHPRGYRRADQQARARCLYGTVHTLIYRLIHAQQWSWKTRTSLRKTDCSRTSPSMWIRLRHTVNGISNTGTQRSPHFLDFMLWAQHMPTYSAC